MSQGFTPLRLFVAALCTLGLSACTTLTSSDSGYYSSPESTRFARQEAQAEQLLREGQVLSAAQEYINIASASDDPLVRQDYQLRAVEVLFDHQEPSAALNVLKQLPPGASSKSLLLRRQMVEAQAALYDQAPRRALSLLPKVEDVANSPLKPKALSLRADALALIGDLDGALQLRSHIDQELTVDAKVINHKAIWALLSPLDQNRLQAMRTRARDPITSGWIDLALAYRFGGGRLDDNLAAWRSSYPGHPASEGIAWQMAQNSPELSLGNAGSGYTQIINISGDNIALLLPLTGRYAPFAEAVREGFDAAILAATRESGAPPPMVRVYDVGESGLSVYDAYQQAVLEGASVAIGPLRKPLVAELLGQGQLSIPLITLNYLDDHGVASASVFQFGLNPEDEATEAARYAIAKGLKRAGIFYPKGEWGERMRRSFAEAYSRMGGTVSTEQSYQGRSNDFTNPLRGLLLANDSRTRHRRLEKVVQDKLQFENWIRDDIDVLFVPAAAQAGRLIQPQLAFFGVIKTPVLSTSRIYANAGNVRLNQDLNGVLFNDTHWTLKSPSVPEETSFQLNALSEGQSLQFMRLHALGADAYALLTQLPAMQNDPGYRYSGFSGDLSLNVSRRVIRHLPWGKFASGRARWVDAPVTFNLDDVAVDSGESAIVE